MESQNELRETLFALKEELKHAQSPYEKFRLYMDLGLTYLLLSNFEDERENLISALLNFDEAEKIAKTISNVEDLSEIESNKGFLFYKLAHLEDLEYNLETSAKHYLKAIELLKDSEQKSKLVNLYYNLANTYLSYKNVENLHESIKYFNLALELKEHTENKKIVGLIYHGLGVCYLMLSKVERDETKKKDLLDSAISNFKESLNYFDPADALDVASTKSHLGSSMLELALITQDRDVFEEALEHFLEALSYYKDEPVDYGTTLFNIGTLFLNESRIENLDPQTKIELLDSAISYFEESKNYFPKEDYPDSFVRINYEIAVSKRELFFLKNDVALLDQMKESLEAILPFIDKKGSPYTYLTTEYFLGEAYYHTGFKEKAIEHFDLSLKVAMEFDPELANNIKEIVETIKKL